MLRRATLILLVLTLVGGAAACGGGSDDDAARSDDDKAEPDSSSDAAAGGPTTVARGGQPGTTPGAGAGDAAAGTAPDASASAPGGAPGDVGSEVGDYTFTREGSAEFCARMSDIQGSVQSGETAADHATIAEVLADVAPPPELADDWATYVDVQQSLAANPSAEGLAAVDEGRLDAFGEASARVGAYLSQVCGL
jgi:hypothetical protein